MSPNDEMCLNSWWPVANQNEKRTTTIVFTKTWLDTFTASYFRWWVQNYFQY